MEHARPPTELVLSGGPTVRADLCQKWQRQFFIFVKASRVHKESSDVQASLLINFIGLEGYDIKKIIKKFDEHFTSKLNTTMARFKFFTLDQEARESIDEYVTALRLLSQKWDFEQLEERLIKDRIVCGIAETSVRDRLLRTDDLTYDKAIKICEACEMSKTSVGGESAELYVSLYSWYNMPNTVHKVLLHGKEIISVAALTIGMLSQEAQEARNKDYHNYRLSHSRKCSRLSCNEDVINMLLATSDPLINSLRAILNKKWYPLHNDAKA